MQIAFGRVRHRIALLRAYMLAIVLKMCERGNNADRIWSSTPQNCPTKNRVYLLEIYVRHYS